MREGTSRFVKKLQKKEAFRKKVREKRSLFAKEAPVEEAVLGEEFYLQAALVMDVGGVECMVKYQGEERSVLVKKHVRGLVVGDLVLLEQEDGIFFITRKLPRKTFIARLRKDNQRFGGKEDVHVLAANVTLGVIVESCAQPEFNAHGLDRYLILCHFGGVRPLLCLTKRDLVTHLPPSVAYYRDVLGIEVIETSSRDGYGMEIFKDALRGKVAVLFGKSGVGKSSLINALLPHLELKTTEVNMKMNGGRHTTTSSSMYEWEKDSYIVDTPGIKALNLDHIPQELIEGYFTEFLAYKDQCKYRDCTHLLEDHCAISQAVEKGLIARERYESYRRLQR